MCPCGRPLHYTDLKIKAAVDALVAQRGETIRITVGSRTWLVPRHYIALHGVKAWELPQLGFQEVTETNVAERGGSA